MMKECSIFVDETGGQGGHSTYYAVTLVIHDQADSLTATVARYESSLRDRGLANIPFHASPLMNGHDAYENMDIKMRKSLFVAFFILFQHMPIRYWTFLYKRSELSGNDAFVARIRKDVVTFLFDNLEYFQSFDRVKIYYDGGQDIVVQSIRKAIDYALSKDATVFKRALLADYRLAQMADLLCTMELVAQKYKNHEQTATDIKFFGSAASFKSYMKSIRRKRL